MNCYGTKIIKYNKRGLCEIVLDLFYIADVPLSNY